MLLNVQGLAPADNLFGFPGEQLLQLNLFDSDPSIADSYLFGFAGLTSTRLIKVLSGIFKSVRAISATSSG
jgi:hypothetical protein